MNDDLFFLGERERSSYSVADLAQRWSIPVSTVRGWLSSGVLPQRILTPDGGIRADWAEALEPRIHDHGVHFAIQDVDGRPWQGEEIVDSAANEAAEAEAAEYEQEATGAEPEVGYRWV